MANYGAKILNNSVQSLAAQQAIIAVTANNISNVNTEGYSRKTVNLETRTSGNLSSIGDIGDGVQIGKITQSVDQYIQKMVREASGDKSSLDIQKSYLERAEKYFSLSDENGNIGSSLSKFFTAINDLSADPSSIELRSNVIQKGQILTDNIKTTFNGIAKLQEEADTRLQTEVKTVNNLTGQIAELNSSIKASESTGNVAADQRDKRELLLQKLSEKISFQKVELEDGTVQVNLSGGFSLVSQSISRNLEYTETPSFASGSTPPSLAGQKLGYIVYDFDTSGSNAHIDLTQILKTDGGGSIGGLLKVRGFNQVSSTSAFSGDGALVDIASRVEALTRGLLTRFNQVYWGDDEDLTTPGITSNTGDLDGNPPAVYGFFDFNYSGVKDLNTNLQPDDLNNPLLGIDNFSSILQLSNTDPRKIAAAIDVNPINGTRNFPPGDGRNLQALSALERESRVNTVGSYSFKGTYSELYNETVTHVSNVKSKVDLDSKISDTNLQNALAKRDEVSGVSLDEEYTNLIKYQKAYQASAKLIKIADDLLQKVLDLV